MDHIPCEDRALEQGKQDPSCQINPVLSCVCPLGTKSCGLIHGATTGWDIRVPSRDGEDPTDAGERGSGR